MFIGLKHVAERFPDAKYTIRETSMSYCLTTYDCVDRAITPYNKHLLYVCDESTIPDRELIIPHMSILCVVNEDTSFEAMKERFPEDVNLLIMQEQLNNAFFRTLRDFFDLNCGYSLIGDTFLEILSFEGGIQAMVDYAFLALDNPIFVFDANFQLIAATWEEAEKHASCREIVENHGFNETHFQIVNSRNHIHEKVKQSEHPVQSFNEHDGYDQLLCAIDPQKDLGHIVVSAVNRPFKEQDQKILWVLKRYIDQQLKKDEFIRNSRGFHYEYFIKDLLDEKIAIGKSFMDRMNYVGNEFSENMYCIVVESARSTSTLNTHRIRNIFEKEIPCTKSLLYNGEIVFITCLPDNKELTNAQVESIKNLCMEHGLFAGMSNCFENILDLAEYYKQALRAIELGICNINEPSLFLYGHHFLDHVKKIFMQKESSSTFCHPKVRKLLEYDKKHHSELAYTLYMYLTHERNTAITASAMYMHRTSLIYRFKKITALIGDDFEDYRERQYMILSYEMNKPE